MLTDKTGTWGVNRLKRMMTSLRKRTARGESSESLKKLVSDVMRQTKKVELKDLSHYARREKALAARRAVGKHKPGKKWAMDKTSNNGLPAEGILNKIKSRPGMYVGGPLLAGALAAGSPLGSKDKDKKPSVTKRLGSAALTGGATLGGILLGDTVARHVASRGAPTKTAKKDMPSFTSQDRPESVKKIYRALKRDHPEMPAEMKARIAARQGKPGKQKQGPPYKGPIKSAATGIEHLVSFLPAMVAGSVSRKAVADGAEDVHPAADIGSRLLSMPSAAVGGALATKAMPQGYWNLAQRVMQPAAGGEGAGLLRALLGAGMLAAPAVAGGAAGGAGAGMLAHVGKGKGQQEMHEPEYKMAGVKAWLKSPVQKATGAMVTPMARAAGTGVEKVIEEGMAGGMRGGQAAAKEIGEKLTGISPYLAASLGLGSAGLAGVSSAALSGARAAREGDETDPEYKKKILHDALKSGLISGAAGGAVGGATGGIVPYFSGRILKTMGNA